MNIMRYPSVTLGSRESEPCQFAERASSGKCFMERVTMNRTSRRLAKQSQFGGPIQSLWGERRLAPCNTGILPVILNPCRTPMLRCRAGRTTKAVGGHRPTRGGMPASLVRDVLPPARSPRVGGQIGHTDACFWVPARGILRVGGVVERDRPRLGQKPISGLAKCRKTQA
jgi:hypothetical protein